MRQLNEKFNPIVVVVLCSLLIGVHAIDKTAVVAGVLGYAGGYLKGAAVHDWYVGGRGYYPTYGQGSYGYGSYGSYAPQPYVYNYGRPAYYGSYPTYGYGYSNAW